MAVFNPCAWELEVLLRPCQIAIPSDCESEGIECEVAHTLIVNNQRYLSRVPGCYTALHWYGKSLCGASLLVGWTEASHQVTPEPIYNV